MDVFLCFLIHAFWQQYYGGKIVQKVYLVVKLQFFLKLRKTKHVFYDLWVCFMFFTQNNKGYSVYFRKFACRNIHY